MRCQAGWRWWRVTSWSPSREVVRPTSCSGASPSADHAPCALRRERQVSDSARVSGTHKLDVLGGRCAAEQRQPAEDLAEDQVEQPQRHVRDHVRPERDHRWSATQADFWHPTCVLKWSDDDVEDRQHEACSTSDGGRPSGFAVQAEIPNHRKLRRLRAGVVSVAVKVPRVAGQVGDEKANVCEPLLTHRNKERWHRNRTVWGGPGQRRALRGASSTGERPACGPGGARCIGGASSSQALVGNRRTCRSDSDGRDWTRLAYRSREGEPQAVMAVSGRVPMRGTGADRFVVAMKAL